MRYTLLTLLATLTLVFALSSAHAADEIYARDGIAIKGYDVVAYFTLGYGEEAVKGSDQYSMIYDGVTFKFASAENKSKFEQNPAKYLPAYGGYCAYAVAEREKKVKIDPNAWSIINGTLYLNYSKGIQERWDKDRDNYISEANQIWPEIKSEDYSSGWF